MATSVRSSPLFVGFHMLKSSALLADATVPALSKPAPPDAFENAPMHGGPFGQSQNKRPTFPTPTSAPHGAIPCSRSQRVRMSWTASVQRSLRTACGVCAAPDMITPMQLRVLDALKCGVAMKEQAPGEAVDEEAVDGDDFGPLTAFS
jgi:hypothetical protein